LRRENGKKSSEKSFERFERIISVFERRLFQLLKEGGEK